MANADIRWLQRLENYERALATLRRALTLAASCPLGELEQLGLIQTFEFTHELSWLFLKDFLGGQDVSSISNGSRRMKARNVSTTASPRAARSNDE